MVESLEGGREGGGEEGAGEEGKRGEEEFRRGRGIGREREGGEERGEGVEEGEERREEVSDSSASSSCSAGECGRVCSGTVKEAEEEEVGRAICLRSTQVSISAFVITTTQKRRRKRGGYVQLIKHLIPRKRQTPK